MDCTGAMCCDNLPGQRHCQWAPTQA